MGSCSRTCSLSRNAKLLLWGGALRRSAAHNLVPRILPLEKRREKGKVTETKLRCATRETLEQLSDDLIYNQGPLFPSINEKREDSRNKVGAASYEK